MKRRMLAVAIAVIAIGVIAVVNGCTDNSERAALDSEVLGASATPTGKAIAPTAVPSPTAVPTATPEPTRVPSPFTEQDVPELNIDQDTKVILSMAAPLDESSDWLVGGSVVDRTQERDLPVVWANNDVSADGWLEMMLPIADRAVIQSDSGGRTPYDGSGRVESVLHLPGDDRSEKAVAVGSIGRGTAQAPAIWLHSNQEWSVLEGPERIDGRATWLSQVVASPPHSAGASPALETDGPGLVLLGGATKLIGRGESIVWSGVSGDWAIDLRPEDHYERAAISRIRRLGSKIFALGWAGAGDGNGDDDPHWPLLWVREGGDGWQPVELPTVGNGDMIVTDIVQLNGKYRLFGSRSVDGHRDIAQWQSSDGLAWSQSLTTLKEVPSEVGPSRTPDSGFAFSEVVAIGGALYAASDNSYHSYMYTSSNGLSWEPIAVLGDLARRDSLTSVAGAGDTIAAIHDRSGLRVSNAAVWTDGSSELKALRLSIRLRLMATGGGSVLVGGHKGSATQVFPRFWIRSDGAWSWARAAAAGQVIAVGFHEGAWIGVGTSSPRDNFEYRPLVWAAPAVGLPWRRAQVSNEDKRDVLFGLGKAGDAVVMVGRSSGWMDDGSWATVPIIVTVPPGSTPKDDRDGVDLLGRVAEVEPVVVDTPDATSAIGWTTCELAGQLLAFITTWEDLPETRASTTALAASSDGTYVIGDQLGGSNTHTAVVNDCVVIGETAFAIGKVETGGNNSARVWTSGDGISWTEHDLGASDDRRWWFTDAVAMDHGLLMFGSDPMVDLGSALWGLALDTDDPGDASAWELTALTNPIGVERPDGIDVIDAAIAPGEAGDELVVIGTHWGYNRVWSAQVRDVLSHLEAGRVPVE